MTGTDHSISIKRYANTRGYHGAAAAYVGLDEVAGMIALGETVVVRDAETGVDITATVIEEIPRTHHG